MASYDAVNAAYNQYLGRPASQDEYTQYWANENDLSGIQNSPEAQAYSARQANVNGLSPSAGDNPYSPDPNVSTGSGSYQGSVAPVTTPQIAGPMPAPGTFVNSAPQGQVILPDASQGGTNSLSNTVQRVQQALPNTIHSTDDPNYWAQKINADPNFQNPATQASAWQYWINLMNGVGGDSGSASSSPAATTSPSSGNAPYGQPSGPLSVQIPQATQDYNASMRQFLLSQLSGDLSQPETMNSPDIAPALQAYNTQNQRDQQANRDSLAERFYAQGGTGGAGVNSGAMNTAVQQNDQAAAGSRASFAGSTVYNASMKKRDQLQAMAQTAAQYGLTDQSQQIQAQIANIDAGLREQGLTQNQGQFQDTLAQNYANLTAQLNRDQMLTALGL